MTSTRLVLRAALALFGCWLPALSAAQETSPAAVPEPAKLLEAVVANQKQVEALVKDYVFLRTDEEEKLDKHGKLKERNVSVYEVSTIGSVQVSRLISRNGRPLSDKEQKKQDEKAQKTVRKAQKEQAQSDKKKTQKQQEDDGGGDLRISDILRATRFFNGRRETVAGRPVIAYDFEPAAGFKPKNRAQDIANKLAGTIWIDDQAHQVAKVQARLLKGVRIAGGILGSVSEGAELRFEQQRINDEVWLPSLVKISAGYRILLSRNGIRQTARFSDYRKFRVEHAITAVEETPPQPPAPR